MKVLRKLGFVFLLSVLVKNSFSQDRFYIYLESQQHQPFYVRIGHELFSSSGDGYLLIPGLTKNTYELIVGFPGSKSAEWSFSCSVNDKDLGLIVEDKGKAGIELLHLDQKKVITGNLVKQQKEVKQEVAPLTGIVSNDPFSTLLADAVNDPTIRMPVIVEKISEPPVLAAQTDSVKSLIAATSPVVAKKEKALATQSHAEEVKSETKQEPLKHEASKPESVKRESEKQESVKQELTIQETVKQDPAKQEQITLEPVKQEPQKKEPVKQELAKQEPEKQEPVKQEPQSSKPAVVKDKGNAPVAVAEKPAQEKKTDKADTATDHPAEKKFLPFVIKETVISGDTKTEDTVAIAKVSETKADEAPKRKESDSFTVRKKDLAKNDKKTKKPQSESGAKETQQDKNAEQGHLPFVISPDAKNQVSGEEKQEEKPVTIVEKSNQKESPPVVAESVREQPREEKPKVLLSNVRKTLERKSRDGIDLIFVDENVNGARDTIRIFIPSALPER